MSHIWSCTMEGTAFVSNKLDNDRYWRGFRQGVWRHSIAVRDFIVRNVSPYEGDEAFLVSSSRRTKAAGASPKQLGDFVSG